MKPELYNPCADGFAAKTWECLRRNKDFIRAFDAHSKNPKRHEWPWEHIGYPLVQEVLDNYKDWKIKLSWPKQKEQRRLIFEGKFKKGGILDSTVAMPFGGAEYQPYKLDRERFISLVYYHPGDTMGDYAMDDKAIHRLQDIWEHHDLIAVPKMIRHDKHRKKILAEIAALIPKSPSKGITHKTTGSTLGSEAKWDSYLLFEDWTKAGYGRGRACGLVAWEKYEAKNVRQSFGKNPKARKQAAADFLATNIGKKQPEKKDTVEGHVASIEKAINSVFPVFAPFDSK